MPCYSPRVGVRAGKDHFRELHRFDIAYIRSLSTDLWPHIKQRRRHLKTRPDKGG